MRGSIVLHTPLDIETLYPDISGAGNTGATFPGSGAAAEPPAGGRCVEELVADVSGYDPFFSNTIRTSEKIGSACDRILLTKF